MQRPDGGHGGHERSSACVAVFTAFWADCSIRILPPSPQRPLLIVAIVTRLVTRLRGLAFWMQTTGAALLGVQQCCVPRMGDDCSRRPCAHGLLYLAPVLDDSCQHEHRQGRVDINAAHDQLLMLVLLTRQHRMR